MLVMKHESILFYGNRNKNEWVPSKVEWKDKIMSTRPHLFLNPLSTKSLLIIKWKTSFNTFHVIVHLIRDFARMNWTITIIFLLFFFVSRLWRSQLAISILIYMSNKWFTISSKRIQLCWWKWQQQITRERVTENRRNPSFSFNKNYKQMQLLEANEWFHGTTKLLNAKTKT